MSCRNLSRGNFVEHELTDDEDSDSEGYVDDFRSIRGRRGGSVRSVSHRSKINTMPNNPEFEEDSEVMSRNNRSTIRSSPKRRGSINRSMAQSNQPAQSSQSSNRNKESLLQDRYERLSMKNVSDSPMTPDSESESAGRKALVQAKIREKLAQQSSLDESSNDLCKAPLYVNKTNLVNTMQQTKESPPISDEQDDIVTNTKNQQDESPNMENVQPLIDDGPIGPPPSTPDQEWECQFCTYVNEPKTKICTICCKTPIVVPIKIDLGQDSHNTILISETASRPNESLPPQVVNTPDITNKNLSKQKSVSPSSKDSSKEDSSSNGKSKGRNKKISFWPGTKPK